MKHALLTTLFIGSCLVISGQVPGTLSYQGMLLQNDGITPIADGAHSIAFNFYDAGTGGTVLFSRTVSVTTARGLYTCIIGGGVAPNAPLSGTEMNQLGAQETFIGITLDGGSELSPRAQLTPAAYAFQAQSAYTIADDAVTSSKIDDGTIVNADISASAAIAGTKIDGTTIAGLNAGNISSGTLSVPRGGTGAGTLSGVLVGNGTGAFAAVLHAAGNQYLRRNAGNTAYEFGTLSTVASSGDYNDLLSRPTILNNTLFNTSTGFEALNAVTTGDRNTANGYQALYSNFDGDSNTANGYQALYANIDGINNTANGSQALYSNTTGADNTANGFSALQSNTTGGRNTANGSYALNSNTTGNNNTANGRAALNSNTTGADNTANGSYALYLNTTGVENIANGYQALYNNSTGDNNTANGNYALVSNTTGSLNTAIGYFSGSTVTVGTNLTMLGYNAQPSSATASNEITLGNNAIAALRCNVQTITSLSDARDKKNIRDLSPGLDFIMKVKPRQFNWDKREWYENNQTDGSKMQHTPTAGFIAQELDEAQTSANAEWLKLVYKENPEKWEATYGNLLPVMVKAIQEQQTQIETLKAKVAELAQLKEELAALKQLVTATPEVSRDATQPSGQP